VVDLGRSFYQQVTPLSSLRHTPEMSIPRPVTVNLIKKVWPNIRHKNGQLVPQTNLFDKFFMWYSCITAVLCVMLGTYALVVLIEPIVKQGVYQYFGASIIPYLFAIFIFKQAESVFSARSLINRLNKMTS
jgi:hypothetical protein